jgi:hypothetical protein
MGITIRQTSRLLAAVAVGAAIVAAETYYPPSESAGGWRRCRSDEEVRNNAGMDPQRLESVGRELSQTYKGPWQIVIIHRGYLVREWVPVPKVQLAISVFPSMSCRLATAPWVCRSRGHGRRRPTPPLPCPIFLGLQGTANRFGSWSWVPPGATCRRPFPENQGCQYLRHLGSRARIRGAARTRESRVGSQVQASKGLKRHCTFRIGAQYHKP